MNEMDSRSPEEEAYLPALTWIMVAILAVLLISMFSCTVLKTIQENNAESSAEKGATGGDIAGNTDAATPGSDARPSDSKAESAGDTNASSSPTGSNTRDGEGTNPLYEKDISNQSGGGGTGDGVTGYGGDSGESWSFTENEKEIWETAVLGVRRIAVGAASLRFPALGSPGTEIQPKLTHWVVRGYCIRQDIGRKVLFSCRVEKNQGRWLTGGNVELRFP